jgi:hypothetical protein
MFRYRNGAPVPDKDASGNQPPERTPGEPVDSGNRKPQHKAEEPVVSGNEKPQSEEEESFVVDGSLDEYEGDVFGPAPYPPGEDLDAYKAMLARMIRNGGPKDVIEEMLIRDVVLLQIDARHLRRVKANLERGSKVDGLKKILSDINPLLNAVEWAERWAAGEPEAIVYIKELLAKRGLSEEMIADEAFMLRLDDIERLDHLIARAEARRALALSEMRRHRASLAVQFNLAQEQFDRSRLDYVPGSRRRR